VPPELLAGVRSHWSRAAQARDLGTRHLGARRRDDLGRSLGSRDAVRPRRYQVPAGLPSDAVLVAVHIRLRDLSPEAPETSYRGRSGRSLPLTWLESISRNVKAALGDRAHIVIVTDGDRARLRAFADEFNVLVTNTLHRNVCADLSLLAQSDVLVSSPTSHSM